MKARTHAVFGVAALVGVALAAGFEPSPYAYPLAAISAWLPDLDNPRSILGNGLGRRKVPLLDALTRPVSWALRLVSFILAHTVGHRTLTHSLLGLTVFGGVVSYLLGAYPELAAAFVSGYASHIFADALNTRGVPLFWPLGRPLRLLPGGVRSGGVAEAVVACVVALLAALGLFLIYVPGAAL